MKKIWIKRFASPQEADRSDENYYLSMTPVERLDTLQFLREIYTKFAKGKKHESGQRLRRVVKILQQA